VSEIAAERQRRARSRARSSDNALAPVERHYVAIAPSEGQT
jgi:hypothetical protein